MSLFITFEGCDGCGKSFQSKALYKRLSHLGISAVLTYEPGGTVLGDEVRRLLKRKQPGNISPEVELFLFTACRFQLVTEVIRPSLYQGKIVLCDRFADSTTVYQGYGRGIDLITIRAMHRLATQGVKPDLTILLDISADEGLRRKRARIKDRFEAEDLDFHTRVREGYLALAEEEPGRWLVIDGELPRRKIGEIIWKKVNDLLFKK